jgi:hypothetical protein
VRRQRWSTRVLAGVPLVGAGLLLWPFADWSPWPAAVGVGLLAVLHLTRLDRLLFGWAPHLAGLLVVVLLAGRSDAWAWGLVTGLGVLGVGLVRLPRRALAAVGAVLALACGTGYGVAHYRTERQRQAERAEAAAAEATNVVAIAPELLVTALTGGDPGSACVLLGSPAAGQLAAARHAPSCTAALAGTGAPATTGRGVVTRNADHTATVAACRAGTGLGTFRMRQFAGGDRYVVIGYAPCPDR